MKMKRLKRFFNVFLNNGDVLRELQSCITVEIIGVCSIKYARGSKIRMYNVSISI